ncbi:hypothetical protein HanRHA438_Chr16g0762061 [Helianthus annuus]|nr:hypothetical protein HanRHA438_Chr16g0762061 [Helianthus annuus]
MVMKITVKTLVIYEDERKLYTLSRPAIDEKSKGFPGNPAPGMEVIGGTPEELDSDEVFLAVSVFSSA